MHAKVLSKLGNNGFKAAQRFPQLRLKPREHAKITAHRRSSLLFDSFEPKSLEYAVNDVQSGGVVEVRRSDDKMIALGFFEPQYNRVDVFDLTPKQVTSLPTVCDDFFIARLHDSWDRRKRLLQQSRNNTYRVCNGYVDGIPSLYVDHFSDCFLRIIATSAGAERLLPSIIEFFRCRGAEEILIDSPTLGDAEKITLVKPSIPMPRVYVEGGIRHMWLPDSVRIPTTENRYLLHPAYRRARQMLRDLGRDKKVLCINDRSAGASLYAVSTAKWVTCVEEDSVFTEWTRENLIANHSPVIFSQRCEMVQSSILNFTKEETYDVVYIENHPNTLCSLEQWTKTLKHLMSHKLAGVGTIIIMSQETAPLAIEDMKRVNKHEPATRKNIAQAIRDAGDDFNLRVRFLRAFSPSYDYPLLPEGESIAFSLVYLIEGPAIE
ncbi:23S rRNA (cytosine1962-C5)-methyltransferase [Angomonas deanei]|nr:23S rRNA (cytosine1962-C5)-methyltransferase [Angomonas deanei]|eukprot:EPY32041.1 23S rRNA (cytosine1962-C5)-methyltransferase [Angomonas deanei]